MEVSRRVYFLAGMLLAAIASVDIVIPVLGDCGHPKSCSSSSSSSHHRGSYYPPSRSSSSSKSPCSSPKSKSSSGTSTPKTTPTTPTTNPPTTPSTNPPVTPSPSTPTTPTPYPPVTTPTTPIVPTLPGPPSTLPNIPGFPFPTTPSGSTPLPPAFGSPITGPCEYWLAHPELINKILGMFGFIGHTFSAPPFPSMFGGVPSVPQALQNTHTDGFGSLLREGAAALLNSVSGHPSGAFPFSTTQVQSSFLGALANESAAAAQAEVFKAANEGRFH